MTAPEPTAVERTIAEALEPWVGELYCRCSWCDEIRLEVAQAVVAAIRNLPPEQMAQLIEGGSVEGRPLRLRVTDAGRIAERRPPGYRERVVGPWREVQS